jgi:3-oxoadipate enol-lactonase
LIEHLGWDEFVLLGHSMGGMIAQTLALAAPRRVRGLILMDTTHQRLEIDPEMVQLGVKVVRGQGLETLVALQRDIEDPLETEAHRRTCDAIAGYEAQNEANTLASDAAMYAAMVLAITEPHDRLTELATIACPTLVIVGDQDAPFIGPSRRMAEAIPNARLEIVADAGHCPQFEAPDGWWAAIDPFLAELA